MGPCRDWLPRPTHPIRLGLALNFSVFYYEARDTWARTHWSFGVHIGTAQVYKYTDKACQLAKARKQTSDIHELPAAGCWLSTAIEPSFWLSSNCSQTVRVVFFGKHTKASLVYYVCRFGIDSYRWYRSRLSKQPSNYIFQKRKLRLLQEAFENAMGDLDSLDAEQCLITQSIMANRDFKHLPVQWFFCFYRSPAILVLSSRLIWTSRLYFSCGFGQLSVDSKNRLGYFEKPSTLAGTKTVLRLCNFFETIWHYGKMTCRVYTWPDFCHAFAK